MSDEDMAQSRFADLMSYRRYEPILSALFTEYRTGEWANAAALLSENGFQEDGWGRIVLCWLTEPEGMEGFAVVLAYDPETYRSHAAFYNMARLLAAVAA